MQIDLKELAVSVIDQEAKAVEKLKPFIDDEFVDHASVDVALNRCGLDKESVLELVRKEQI